MRFKLKFYTKARYNSGNASGPSIWTGLGAILNSTMASFQLQGVLMNLADMAASIATPVLAFSPPAYRYPGICVGRVGNIAAQPFKLVSAKVSFAGWYDPLQILDTMDIPVMGIGQPSDWWTPKWQLGVGTQVKTLPALNSLMDSSALVAPDIDLSFLPRPGLADSKLVARKDETSSRIPTSSRAFANIPVWAPSDLSGQAVLGVECEFVPENGQGFKDVTCLWPSFRGPGPADVQIPTVNVRLADLAGIANTQVYCVATMELILDLPIAKVRDNLTDGTLLYLPSFVGSGATVVPPTMTSTGVYSPRPNSWVVADNSAQWNWTVSGFNLNEVARLGMQFTSFGGIAEPFLSSGGGPINCALWNEVSLEPTD